MPREPEKKAVEAYVAEVRRRCPECRVTQESGKWGSQGVPSYRIDFPDGYWIKATPDPWVVEIIAKPQTLAELRERRNTVQTYIFDAAHAVGLEPGGSDTFFSRAAGHFNFGTISGFGNDGRAFLRFIVDYSNSPQLASGAMGLDYFNAPPLTTLPAQAQNAMQNLIRRVNTGEQLSPAQIAAEITRDVYIASPYVGTGESHYQAIGLESAQNASSYRDAPSELRALRMQKNADEFIQLAEVVERRALFSRDRGTAPIIYAPPRNLHFSRQSMVNGFYIYLTEMGLDFEKYKNLLMDDLRGVQPDRFLTHYPDWHSHSYAESLQSHLDEIPRSDWLRDRVLAALSNPAAPANERGLSFVREIMDRSHDPDIQPIARAAYENLVQKLSEFPHWNHIALTRENSGYFRRHPLHLPNATLSSQNQEIGGCEASFLKTSH